LLYYHQSMISRSFFVSFHDFNFEWFEDIYFYFFSLHFDSTCWFFTAITRILCYVAFYIDIFVIHISAIFVTFQCFNAFNCMQQLTHNNYAPKTKSSILVNLICGVWITFQVTICIRLIDFNFVSCATFSH
jgi:hypothetical protein